MVAKKHYRSIFISDVHLGARSAKANELAHFLKSHSCDQLYLVGDIIDAWKIKQNKWNWKSSHQKVVRQVLKHAHRKSTEVIYIPGNHDEFLRPLIRYKFTFGRIKIVGDCEHVGADGKRYLVTHGDLFDGISQLAPWLAFLGDKAYDFALAANALFNWVRRRFGMQYWSLSKFLKHRVKQSMAFIFQFEKNLAEYAKKRNFDGVIAGHIHHPEIKMVDDIVYMNSGDWVESLTALVEDVDGTWSIVHWTLTGDEDRGTETTSQSIDSNGQSSQSSQRGSDNLQ